MIVKRQELLKTLEMVAPGLSSKETTDQSSCFVFKDGCVITYNDEVAVRTKSGLEVEFTGAVIAEPLLKLLQRVDVEEVEITSDDNHLSLKAGRKRASIKMEAKITMPVDSIESPKAWKDLPKDFMKALEMVVGSTGTDESKFVLTCVHISPEHVEACDNFQLTRFPLKWDTPAFLLPAPSVLRILAYQPLKIGLTASWVHFQDASGTVFTCRSYTEKYPNLTDIMAFKGTPIQLPKGLEDIVKCAEIFSASDLNKKNEVIVSLAENKLTVRGEGEWGWFQEARKCDYTSDAVQFRIGSALLLDIANRTSHCQVESGKRLKIQTDNYVHVVHLTVVK